MTQISEKPGKVGQVQNAGAMSSSDQHNKRLGACPICASTSYTWGQPGGTSFTADGVGKLKAMLDSQKWRARLCLGCGNMQVFLEER